MFGILRGKLYTCQSASMLTLAYFAEGAVRAWSDRGLSAQMALAEIALALIFFAACLCYVHLARRRE